MCKEILLSKLKKLSMFLTLSLIICIFTVLGYASSIAYAANEANVTFVEEYAKPGQVLSVELDGVETTDTTVIWKVDGKKVAVGLSYTPKTSDLEKFIEVSVLDSKNNVICENKLLCSKLPVIYINTENGAEVVSKEEYIDADLYIQGNEKYNSNTVKLYDGKTEIKGRGNSTWLRFDKKPYKLKLNKSTNLFGLGKNKHWVLLANYIDESLVRNYLSGNIASRLGSLCMDSVFVDLVLNGEHVGNYLLTEHVRISSDRVDVYDWEETAGDAAKAIAKKEKLSDDEEDELKDYMEQNLSWMSSDEVTFNGKTYCVSEYLGEELPSDNGGYLLEMDNMFDEISSFYTSRQVPIMVKSPEYINTNDKAYSELQTYIQNFEDAIYSTDHTTTVSGKVTSYTELCDFETLISFWLSCEILENEIGFKSTDMYKGVDEKLKFGPVWDFDFSSGSVSPFGGQSTTAWISQNRWWFSEVMKDPYFAVKVRELFLANEDYLESLTNDGQLLDELYDYLYESGIKNDELWGYSRGFEEDSTVLKEWLSERIFWISQQFATDESSVKSLGGTLSNFSVSLDEDAVIANNGSTYYADEKSDAPLSLLVETANSSAVNYNCYINTKYISSGNIEDGKAIVDLSKDLFTEESGKKNVVVIRLKDADGNFTDMQFVTVSFVDADSSFCTLTLSDGEKTTQKTVISGERVYLTESENTTESNIFAGWTDGSITYPVNSKITVNSNVTLEPVWVRCKDGSNLHQFEKNDNYICTICGSTKADDGTYTDVNLCTFTPSNKYYNKYTGSAVTPVIEVTYGEQTLTEGVHYTLEVKNNILPGYATYTVTGIKNGSFNGSVQLSYKIIPRPINEASNTFSSAYYYTGAEITPRLNLTFNGKTLVSGVDYNVTAIENNINAGTGKITVEGIGNFSGSKTITFTINPKKAVYSTVSVSEDPMTYTGKKLTPTLTVKDKSTGIILTQGKDYTVSYENNLNVGTATAVIDFIGNYSGTVSKNFTIKSASSSALTVYLSASSFTYAGKAVKPQVTVKTADGTVVSDSNYTVSYSDNNKPGTAYAKVTFKGNYYGSKTVSFKIALGTVKNIKAASAKTSVTLSWSKVSGAQKYQVYMYNPKTKKYEKKATVATNKAIIKKLSAGTTYKFKIRAVYKNTTAVYGSYSSVFSTATKPTTAKISTVKSSAANSATIKWNKISGANGYQVYYSTSKAGSYKKLTTTSKTSVTYKGSKLKSGKTYYFKVRAYKTVGKTNIYGSFSPAKSLKIK